MPRADNDLEGVVQRLAPDLLAYFTRRVDPPDGAADLLQETLLVLCRKPASVPEEPQEQRMWAFGVARKVLATHRRTGHRRSELLVRLRQELRPVDQGSRAHDELLAAMATLDPEDQEIIRLIHWEGFQQSEVAQIIGRPAATVRSRYFRARQSLRRSLDTANDEMASPAGGR